jgi:hypothetical protein
MIACNILKVIDPMISYPEMHNCIIPPNPAPVPLPYVQVSFLGHGIVAEKSKYSGGPSFVSKGQVIASYFPPILQGNDCGFFSPHFGNPANVLFPLILTFSSSKSLFTASTVQINGAPTAAACFIVININLNCAFPISMPFGGVPAATTVQVGLSIGDYLAGIVSGIAQMALDQLFGWALGSVGANRLFSNIGSRLFVRSITSNIHVATPLANAFARYVGMSGTPFVAAAIAQQVASDGAGAVRGLILDQTPGEDGINSITTRGYGWIGTEQGTAVF